MLLGTRNRNTGQDSVRYRSNSAEVGEMFRGLISVSFLFFFWFSFRGLQRFLRADSDEDLGVDGCDEDGARCSNGTEKGKESQGKERKGKERKG